ncbi:MAG: NAD(P)H-hydrate dehydratase [archaeon]
MKLIRKNKKGENGKVLIVGGSEDYTGALILAGIAAYRTGVDIVTIAAPEKVAWAINSYSPDIITKKLLGKELDITHSKEIIDLSLSFDAVLIGNGLGIKKDFVNKLVRSINLPKVIDADAIKVTNISLIKNSIITPHIKEFEFLFQNSIQKKEFLPDINQNIKEMQKVMNDNVVLLKGIEDIVFSSNIIHKNKTGHNSMTVGGTGDILAGLCAGFLAQSKDLIESAKFAAFVNGRAGESMFKQKGYSYMASDMLNELGRFTR